MSPVNTRLTMRRLLRKYDKFMESYFILQLSLTLGIVYWQFPKSLLAVFKYFLNNNDVF